MVIGGRVAPTWALVLGSGLCMFLLGFATYLWVPKRPAMVTDRPTINVGVSPFAVGGATPKARPGGNSPHTAGGGATPKAYPGGNSPYTPGGGATPKAPAG